MKTNSQLLNRTPDITNRSPSKSPFVQKNKSGSLLVLPPIKRGGYQLMIEEQKSMLKPPSRMNLDYHDMSTECPSCAKYLREPV